MRRTVLRAVGQAAAQGRLQHARRCSSGAAATTPPPAAGGESGDNVADMLSRLEKIELGDDEVKRLATVRGSAPLPELMGIDGADLSGVIPEALFEEDTVDLAMAFVEQCEALDLSDAILAKVEAALDTVFENGTPAARFAAAKACLSEPVLADNARCATFLAKLMHDALHWGERRVVLTLAYHSLGRLPLLASLWRIDDLGVPLVVTEGLLDGYLTGAGSEAALEACLAGLPEVDLPFAEKVRDVGRKRGLRQVLEVLCFDGFLFHATTRLSLRAQEAFVAFADETGHANASEIKQTLDKVLSAEEAAEWYACVGPAPLFYPFLFLFFKTGKRRSEIRRS